MKLIVMGNIGIEKTNFIFPFIEDKFSVVYAPTVGFYYKSKMKNLPNIKKK